MCGICGKLIFRDEVVEQSLLTNMCETLIHRGPDDQGIYAAPHIGLGQRRLSIIDLSNSATAPLSNEDGTIWVVLNGEIYNFQQLRTDLIRQGHQFRAATDTEVIVHLYEEYGIDCLARMRGMFAFALWDSRKGLLFAARDRLGKKPFFYTKTSASVIFGSEIKAITADPEVSVAPNYRAIDQYLTYQYVPSPLSAFEGIYKLPPAHFLTCTTEGTLEVSRYWSPPLTNQMAAPDRDIEEELLRRLREAVRLRLVSDVPLGAFLSGGIDSSVVVALMALESGKPVKTFSIGFEEEAYSELPYARLVAERYQTDHHEFTVKPDAAEVLPLLVRHYNEPFADSSALPTYYVSKLTRQHVTVALSGDGGDECFCGYDRYAQLAAWSRLDAVPETLRKATATGAVAVLERLPYSNLSARLSRGFRMVAAKLPERYILEMTTLKPEEKRRAYTPFFRNLLTNEPGSLESPVSLAWNASTDELDWMMRHDQSFYLPDCLMVKVDIASMANSLEVRSPFLDHEFVEFASTIPSAMKRDATGGKLVLKNAVKQLLPPEVLAKRKMGFGIPLAKWLRHDLADLLRGTLLDDRARRRNLFAPSVLATMVDEHVEGRRDWGNRLWAFLFLELWFREFID